MSFTKIMIILLGGNGICVFRLQQKVWSILFSNGLNALNSIFLTPAAIQWSRRKEIEWRFIVSIEVYGSDIGFAFEKRREKCMAKCSFLIPQSDLNNEQSTVIWINDYVVFMSMGNASNCENIFSYWLCLQYILMSNYFFY